LKAQKLTLEWWIKPFLKRRKDTDSILFTSTKSAWKFSKKSAWKFSRSIRATAAETTM
jgi:hypothetical protein